MLDFENWDIDLGDNHKLKFYRWSPDRDLNPQYSHVPDIEKHGVFTFHLTPDGKECKSAIEFDSEAGRELHRIYAERCKAEGREPRRHVVWQVHSWEPLTVTPSLHCMACGDHGFITNGKWVHA